ncbi:MAG: hypothetical protein FWG14_14245 [Peptococcaceae bacterium]|nr:hypothetical protein [Peptococcaceae bacterium]
MTGITVSGTAPPKKEDCEAAEKNNNEEREYLTEIAPEYSQVGPKGIGKILKDTSAKKSVVATMKMIGETSVYTSIAFTGADSLLDEHRNNLELGQGPNKETGRYDDTIELCEKDYEHSHAFPDGKGRCSGNCAESRLLYGLKKFPKSELQNKKLLFKVENNKPPCEGCYSMMCHAQDNCKVVVYICDKDNKPKNLTGCDKGVEGGGYAAFLEQLNPS